MKDGSGSVLLDKTCGSKVPSKIVSTSNKVEILFHSDYSVTAQGFKITWKVIASKNDYFS